MECGYIGLFAVHRGMPHIHTLTLYDRDKPANIGILLKLLPRLESITVSRDSESEIWQDLSTGRIGPRLKHIISPVSSVKATLDFLKNRYDNATRLRQQHDGWAKSRIFTVRLSNSRVMANTFGPQYGTRWNPMKETLINGHLMVIRIVFIRWMT